LVVVVGKPLAALLIVLARRHPLRTGLIVAAGLAQIGEFSFIHAELGRTLGLLPDEGYSLVLAGALLSITLNPIWFRVIDPLESWLHRRGITALVPGRSAASSEASDTDKLAGHELREHTVLCGYGRVGSVIGRALEQHGVEYLVVEQDRQRIDEPRRRSIVALEGDAADRALLEQMDLTQARLLVVAIPDPLATRHIVEWARRQNPGLAIIARTQSDEERAYLGASGVSEAIVAERELALAMSRLTLRHLGHAAVGAETHDATAGDNQTQSGGYASG
jgi:monovalent cation:H+ antiporter-2, CPA2 family